ncbi:hypothetical protein K4K61_003036 [Colletotrichum sp. SAR11_59]|nr:hypothetical protein K4K61_003036 [Colletotrichum sp. SAR11_59]
MLTSKAKASHPLNGMHTAGIFADPSVDGPLIGTLVAIVDRAKNLPNRKTMGKQDPYCAARLGKEAKKTTTDIRGGQTPKWDQELRFAVHDSPDYYQLKVSVFHDDKKTDLIGETWVDLRDIIVPGGGQNDLWRNLTFKGKYAGEIRMEITYYDIRPKPEKPVAKPKPVEAEPIETYASHGTIPRKQIKRRPLPSDPFTGEAPAAPSPEQSPTPPRAGGPRGPKEMSAPSSPAPEPREQPSLSGSRPMPTKKPAPAQVPSPSPLQAIEYHASPASRSQPELPAPTSPAALPHPAEVTPQHTPTRHERYDSPTSQHDERDYSPRYASQEIVDRAHYRQGSEPPPRDSYLLEDSRNSPAAEDDRPPPPPAHRSRGNSQDMVLRGSFDTPPKSANAAMRQDVLRNEAHRMSFSTAAYPGRPQYRGFDSAPEVRHALPAPEDHFQEQSHPRHHSYDGHAEYRSMQPTVEDVPESPTPANKTTARRTSRVPPYDELGFGQDQKPAPPPPQALAVGPRQPARAPQYQEPAHDQGYDQVPSPAPLNIGGRGSAGSRQRGQSPNPAYDRGNEMVSSGPYSTSPQPDYQPQGNELVFAGRGSASPGRFSTSPQPEYQQDYQQDYRQQPEYQPRGDELVLAGRGNASPAHYSTSPQPYVRGDEMVRHQPVSPMSMRDPRGDEMSRRAMSPNPSHTIKRKSVSPAPPPDHRRLSGVPFGPDSYDALNPTLSATGSDISRPDPDEKIITHDGREIDPSDHLPMDTWAPEPEPKGPKTPATASVSPVSYDSDQYNTPPAPNSGARNRLQKKTQRMSALPSTSPAGSSPLAPISSHNYQDHGSDFTPPRMSRASTWDYPSENHAPQYGSSPGGMRGGPPIPAKIPLPIMSGANNASESEWALMQEMSRIDIGAGRSRRHRY